MKKGQKWGTYHKDEWCALLAHMSKNKKTKVKALAAMKGLTMSAMVNKLLSIELAKAGIADDSFSFEL